MSQKTIDIVKATAPAVAAHAEEITTLFYKTMFANSPAAKAFFNTANQQEGRQAKALAASIIAYATHIDDLGALTEAIELIVTKHCGLQVLPEHYPIVHDNLLIAVAQVLGDAITPEVGAAWSEAVNFLAKVLYQAEEEKYKAAEARSGGWRGWKEFTVSGIDSASTNCKTFTFVPKEGSVCDSGFDFTPGQYLSVSVDGETPRHYTVTSAPGQKALQITTKRLDGGAVSTFMHDKLSVGDSIKLSPPFGPFAVKPDTKSAVLLSAGIGMTPMKAFLDTHGALVTKAVHVDRNAASAPFYAHFEEKNAGKNQFIFTETGGRPDMAAVSASLVKEGGLDHRYYVCGPTGFMQKTVHGLVAAGVPRSQIVWEAFSPQLSCPV